LELLLQVRSAEYDSWLANLKQAATNSGTRAFVLGRWLAKVNGLDDSLAWINTLPDEVQNSPPLAFLVADCQVLQRDWQALLEGIESQNWGEADPQRMALIALGKRSLHLEADFQTAWRDALREADHHRDSLLRLAQFASRWGWNGQRAEVVERIAAEFPDEKLVADLTSDKPSAPAQDAAAALIDAHL
jgi:hypothetical protein